MTAVGTCTVAANQAGNGDYNAAPEVTQSFGVGQAASETVVTCPASVVYNGVVRSHAPSGHRRWRTRPDSGPGLREQHQRRYGDGELHVCRTTNHLGSSDSTDFEIKKAPVTATGGGGSATYDGDSKTPSDCEVTGTYTGDLDCTNDREVRRLRGHLPDFTRRHRHRSRQLRD